MARISYMGEGTNFRRILNQSPSVSSAYWELRRALNEGVVSPKIQAAIKEAKETGVLERGRKLVRLESAVPLALDWAGWRSRAEDAAKLLDLFQQWGFRGFA